MSKEELLVKMSNIQDPVNPRFWDPTRVNPFCRNIFPSRNRITSNEEKFFLPTHIVFGGFQNERIFARFSLKQKTMGTMGAEIVTVGNFGKTNLRNFGAV